jgi:menaquinone-dependent protoporphyrinogen IX oxidase
MAQQVKKVLVIYKSKYGSTKRYAQWIADAVKGDLIEASKAKAKDLLKYDTIVFGGFLHAVGINGVKIIIDNYKKIMDKKIIVFAVGCSPHKSEDVEKVFTTNFKGDIKENINFFYLRGAFKYENLGFLDKMMMNVLKVKLSKIKEEDRNEDIKGLLECYDNPMDWTDRNSIKPIVQCINNK